MTDQPPAPPSSHRRDSRLPDARAAVGLVQFAAGLAFLIGVAAWSHNQFLWPRWLILLGLLALYTGAAWYRRRRRGAVRRERPS